MRGQELREKLFNIYAINLSEIVPGIKDTFRCPICLKDFHRSALGIDQELTLGHIIPDALNGSIRTLECGKCNSTIGSAYDSHAANMKKFTDWLNMKEGAEKQVRINDGVSIASAFASWGPNQELIFKAVNWKDPNYKKQGERIFSNQGKLSFTLNVNSKCISERRIISIIHSAYLMMFYCFGYEYILSPEANIIRTIINEGKSPWEVGKMLSEMNGMPPLPTPAAGIIREPQDIRCFIILLPNPENPGSTRIALFPGFGSIGTKSFKHLLKLRERSHDRIDIKFRATNEGPCPNGFLKALWYNHLPDSA